MVSRLPVGEAAGLVFRLALFRPGDPAAAEAAAVLLAPAALLFAAARAAGAGAAGREAITRATEQQQGTEAPHSRRRQVEQWGHNAVRVKRREEGVQTRTDSRREREREAR